MNKIIKIISSSFLIYFLLVGCSTNNLWKNNKKYKHSLETKRNLDKLVQAGHALKNGKKINIKPEATHIEKFEISRGENAESIFRKASIITKKVYVINSGKEFTSTISTDNIRTEDDIKLYLKVQGYRLDIKNSGKYAIVEIKKIQDSSYKILKDIKVEIKGYAPFDIVFSELIKDTGIIYNPTDLGRLASVPTNFYFSGNLSDCLIYATNLIGIDIEFDGMNLIHSRMKTVLLEFEFPVRDTRFTASISSSTGGAAGSSTSTKSNNKTTTTNSSDTGSLVSAFKSNISKKVSDMLINLKSDKGGFSYISELGQISVTDYPKNIKAITKVINNLNDKFKEQVKIELKFYKYTTSVIKDRGINLSGKINDFITYGITKGTLNTNITTPNLNMNFNDGTTDAILNYLNTYGKAKVEHTISFLSNNNQIRVEKIASNRGYISNINSSVNDGVVTADMTPSSISDGSFIATFARTMNGNKIALELFLTINDLKQFVNRTAGNNTVQTPDTDEQSHFNTITLQNNVPYILNHYEVKNKNNKKTSIPILEDYSFTDAISSDKHDNKERTYIITEVKVTRGY
jgi:hypothetical protein